MASTGSQGPVSAASTALWLNEEVHDTELMMSRVTGSTNGEGKARATRTGSGT